MVVPTRDRSARLRRLLRALEAQSLPARNFEVIVVDNGSLDDTPAALAQEAGSTRLVLRALTRPRGGGPGAARNDGWRVARASLVAFTDDDCEPAPRWLEELLAAARRMPGAPIQGRTSPSPRELARSGPFSRTQSIDSAGPLYQTCNMAYPRSLLERLGGFDERFVEPAGEDADLAWRALEGGCRIGFAPLALVHHAVEDLGPKGHLRVAARWSELAYVMKRHPGLRARVRWRAIFWKRSHFLLAGALLALAVSTRSRAAWLLALPYARHLADRCREAGCSPAYAAYFAIHDLVEMAALTKGSLKHRVLLL